MHASEGGLGRTTIKSPSVISPPTHRIPTRAQECRTEVVHCLRGRGGGALKFSAHFTLLVTRHQEEKTPLPKLGRHSMGHRVPTPGPCAHLHIHVCDAHVRSYILCRHIQGSPRVHVQPQRAEHTATLRRRTLPERVHSRGCRHRFFTLSLVWADGDTLNPQETSLRNGIQGAADGSVG